MKHNPAEQCGVTLLSYPDSLLGWHFTGKIRYSRQCKEAYDTQFQICCIHSFPRSFWKWLTYQPKEVMTRTFWATQNNLRLPIVFVEHSCE
jgi:hypothetical protein